MDELYMRRCIELARLGAGYVAPNPMVGAVLVHGHEILGEGYHRQYGQAHAEVNCIGSVSSADEHLISRSTLYVSLEPCAHFGKTAPCADLIIRKKIPRVVVGVRDPFKEVDGRGIEKLIGAGTDVRQNVLERECADLNKRFFTFHIKHRPFIILKWAQSSNSKIGGPGAKRALISNELTNRKVHKWRSEEASILVGANTARLDNPELTVRWWQGSNPIRLLLDGDLHLPGSLKIFNSDAQTIVFNNVKHEAVGDLLFFRLANGGSLVHQVVHALYQLNIQSVMIEGGAKTLQSFINEQMWDEARVIVNEELVLEDGPHAPEINNAELVYSEKVWSDSIHYYKNLKS